MIDGGSRKAVAAALTAACLLALPWMGPRESGAASPLSATAAATGKVLPDGIIGSPERGWPQFRGVRRDGISDEKGLVQTWPQGGPTLLWKIGELGRGWSSPIVVGERLYITGDVGGDLVIFAFDLEGTVKWKVKNGRSWKGSYPGARASCAYSEGRLYHMNAHGRVVCLDAETGAEQWAVDVLERFGGKNITWAMSECLLVDGPRVIVTPGGTKGLMAALDKTDGKTAWTTEPIPGDAATYSSPILFRFAGRRLLANCSSAHGFGVDADTGKLLWTIPLRNRYNVTVSAPVYGDGRLFYVAPDGPNGRQYALRAGEKGVRAEEAWKTDLDTLTGYAILLDGSLYGSGYRNLKWWFCLDWKTGQTRYELKDLTTGAAIHADGRLYCLAEDGRAALLKPSAGALEVVGQFRLVEARSRDAWAHPVVCDGRLYLRYHDALWCYDVRAK